MNGPDGSGLVPGVNIIIPVYRNLDVTRRCLESVLASDIPRGVSVTVIDDASPEEDVSEYCRMLAAQGRVKLLVNPSNRGFVASANRGFSAQPEDDILLLNSDTEVANDWVERLAACAYRDEAIGTVTPFSNNATICSYPFFPLPAPLPGLWDTASLDQVFQSANTHGWAKIPTAVGFCMFIKRRCLNEVGGFDEENFGLGYGEECDFSMRAQAQSWKNVLAADVFVFHEGAVSFSTESGERKAKADLVMQSLHPQYDGLITDFIRNDPLAQLRENVDAVRAALKPEDVTNLLLESAQSRSVLRKRAVEVHSVLLSEREVRENQEKTLAKTLEKSVWLEQQLAKQVELYQQQNRQFLRLEDLNRHHEAENESLTQLLQQSRAEFALTDEALAQAQHLAARLREDLDQTTKVAAELGEEIVLMKQSRSWRYTAWMRRAKGGL